MVALPLEEAIIQFAKENKIKEVTRGIDPEEGFRTYYFLNESERFDFSLSAKLVDLEIFLGEGNFGQWPYSENPEDRLPFLGETIYKN